MNLGEQIYTLRTRQGMSQGDLADRLDVSRQSVSKWENNSAVPDLDKLLKLSEVFRVTLDELVKGAPTPPMAPASTADPASAPAAAFEKRMIAGVLLGCMTFLLLLVLLATGQLLGLGWLLTPFLLCTAICFLVKRHTALWCGWVVFLCVDLYIREACGLDWCAVLHNPWPEDYFFTPRRLMSCGLLLGTGAMIAVTVRTFGAYPVSNEKACRLRCIAGWGLFLLLSVGLYVVVYTNLNTYLIQRFGLMGIRFDPAYYLGDWLRFAALTMALTETVRHVRWKDCQQNDRG